MKHGMDNKRLTPGKKRSESSRRWLRRQLSDPYVAKAQALGWRSRAAFKLLEIDAKYHILTPGARVIDLGSAPGGWCQVAARAVGSTPDRPLIIGIDIVDMEAIAGVMFMRADFTENETPAALNKMIDGGVDVVLSDMAQPATGHKKTDHLRIMHLCELAADFAGKTLKPGGHFLAKVLKGGTETQLLTRLKREYTRVHHVKPPASRKGSAEAYVLAQHFRGNREQARQGHQA